MSANRGINNQSLATIYPTAKGSGGSLAVDKFARIITASGLALPVHDFMGGVETDTVTETYTFRQGGSGGTIVGTMVIVYSSTAKTFITSVTVTPTL